MFSNSFVSIFDGPISDIVLFSRNKFFPLYDVEQFKYGLSRIKKSGSNILSDLEDDLFNQNGSIDLLVCGSIGYAVVCYDLMKNGLLNSEMLPKSFEFDSVKIFYLFFFYLFFFFIFYFF